MAFWFAVCMVAALCALLLLSFFAPIESESIFWKGVKRLRAILDTVCYWIINGIAIASLLLVLFAILVSVVRQREMATAIVLAVVALLAALSMRKLAAELRRGEQCDCIGDCSKCAIQCQNNQKYYGILRDEHGKILNQGIKDRNAL